MPMTARPFEREVFGPACFFRRHETFRDSLRESLCDLAPDPRSNGLTRETTRWPTLRDEFPLPAERGEGQGEGGGRRDRFQPMFSRLSPLPGPLPARSSRGEGEAEAPPALGAFVACNAGCPVGPPRHGHGGNR